MCPKKKKTEVHENVSAGSDMRKAVLQILASNKIGTLLTYAQDASAFFLRACKSLKLVFNYDI